MLTSGRDCDWRIFIILIMKLLLLLLLVVIGCFDNNDRQVLIKLLNFSSSLK